MDNPQRESLGRTLARFSSSTIARRIGGLINTFIKPKLLPPELYGLWNGLSIIYVAAVNLHLGARELLPFLISHHRARGETGEMARIEAAVFYGSLALTLLLAVAVAAAGLFWVQETVVRVGLGAIAVLVVLNCLLDFNVSRRRGYQDFTLLSRLNYLRAGVTLILNLVLIYLFGIYGAFAATLSTVLALLVFLRRQGPIGVRGRFRLSVFKDLVRRGFPLMAFGFLIDAVAIVDRLAVLHFLGREQLGFYAIAALIMGVMAQIPSDAHDILEPRLMEDKDHQSTAEVLENYFFRPMTVLAYVMPILAGVGILLLPHFLELVLPRYVPATLAAQIVLVGAVLYTLTFPATGLIVLHDLQWPASLLVAVILPLDLALNAAALKLGLGLPGVAGASLAAFLVIWLALMALIYRRLRAQCGWSVWRRHLEGLIWPLPVMIASLYGLGFLAVRITGNPLLGTLLQLPLFLGIMGGLFLLARRRYPAIAGLSLKGLLREARG